MTTLLIRNLPIYTLTHNYKFINPDRNPQMCFINLGRLIAQTSFHLYTLSGKLQMPPMSPWRQGCARLMSRWVKCDSTLTRMSWVRVDSGKTISRLSWVRVESYGLSHKLELSHLGADWVKVESTQSNDIGNAVTWKSHFSTFCRFNIAAVALHGKNRLQNNIDNNF